MSGPKWNTSNLIPDDSLKPDVFFSSKKDKRITLRLPNELYERLKQDSNDGNVSKYIRKVIDWYLS